MELDYSYLLRTFQYTYSRILYRTYLYSIKYSQSLATPAINSIWAGLLVPTHRGHARGTWLSCEPLPVLASCNSASNSAHPLRRARRTAADGRTQRNLTAEEMSLGTRVLQLTHFTDAHSPRVRADPSHLDASPARPFPSTASCSIASNWQKKPLRAMPCGLLTFRKSTPPEPSPRRQSATHSLRAKRTGGA